MHWHPFVNTTMQHDERSSNVQKSDTHQYPKGPSNSEARYCGELLWWLCAVCLATLSG